MLPFAGKKGEAERKRKENNKKRTGKHGKEKVKKREKKRLKTMEKGHKIDYRKITVNLAGAASGHVGEKLVIK